ncbi:MAG: hypothetical protein ABEJ28_05560 [Salinigranum sp.]
MIAILLQEAGEASEAMFPVSQAGAVVLVAGLLITLGWLWYMYR